MPALRGVPLMHNTAVISAYLFRFNVRFPVSLTGLLLTYLLTTQLHNPRPLIVHHKLARPQPPVSADVLDNLSTPHSITVQWEPGDDGGAAQWFMVSYRFIRDNSEFGPEEKVEGSFGEIVQHVVTDLITSTEYQIRVFAENVLERSDTAVYQRSFTLRKFSVEDS